MASTKCKLPLQVRFKTKESNPMPIPEFNEIKAPALQFFTDGLPHKIPEVYGVLAGHFKLTESDLAQLLPSGTQTRWENRANWACYDLFRAGLLDRPKRAWYQITSLGKTIAETKPAKIDREFLMQFPSFVEFVAAHKGPKSAEDTGGPPPGTPSDKTPEEIMGDAHRQLRDALRQDLLEVVTKMNPLHFERLVLDLMVAMGYGGSREEAAHMTKASHDEGIDGVINEDRLGLDVIYLQAKRWNEAVGRKEIQSFVGALAGKKASKGVFITTSTFAKTAEDYARNLNQKVILIDGDRLADLMIQHNIGVAKKAEYQIKQVDSDYFGLD